ncbi:MAG TPA: hypothetical protein VF246_04375 [Acidimicrobiia bacterium]
MLGEPGTGALSGHLYRLRTAIVGPVALLLTACGVPGAGTTTTMVAPERTTTLAAPVTSSTIGSTTTDGPVEWSEFSYDLEVGQVYTYEVDVDQTFEMTTAGEPRQGGLWASSDLPERLVVVFTGTALVRYEVGPGPSSDSFVVAIVSDLSDVEVDVTSEGESDLPDDPGELSNRHEVEVLVSRQGRVDPMGPEAAMSKVFVGGLLEEFEEPWLLPSEFIGPWLPSEFSLGHTWTQSLELPLFEGWGGEEGPVHLPESTTMTTTYTVNRGDLEGAPVLVVENVSVIPDLEFDMAALILALTAPELPGLESADEATFFALLEDSRYLVELDRSETRTTTWLDPARGLVLGQHLTGASRFTTDVHFPSEVTGEEVTFTMSRSLTRDLTYRLVEAP